jgi:D-alanine--poly(phosphoribitol) ligase subunit 2
LHSISARFAGKDERGESVLGRLRRRNVMRNLPKSLIEEEKSPMETHEIMSELRQFIRQQFGIPENDPDFNDNVDLFNYGYIDSFGAVELTSFMESKFSTTVAESDWATLPLSTIQEISSFISKRQKGEI